MCLGMSLYRIKYCDDAIYISLSFKASPRSLALEAPGNMVSYCTYSAMCFFFTDFNTCPLAGPFSTELSGNQFGVVFQGSL